ncbi:MAG: response regulator [Caulobacteraceae bacterium]
MKFTDAGGVELAVDRSVKGLSFKVRDSGIGFDEEARRKLFRRFEQADASITRRFGGTGLGLAICRSLVEMMDGEIIVTSEPGQGSTFEVAVPMERVGDVQPVAADAKPVQEMVSDDLRVLLAEDHPANQRVVQLLLEPLGVDLTIVEDGQAALDRLASERFDVVLMDMQMPVMDGLTATIALRLHEAATGAARTPVIMLTANALDDHIKASVEAGADRHLSKPIRADALIGAISEVIAEREAAVIEEVA